MSGTPSEPQLWWWLWVKLDPDADVDDRGSPWVFENEEEYKQAIATLDMQGIDYSPAGAVTKDTFASFTEWLTEHLENSKALEED